MSEKKDIELGKLNKEEPKTYETLKEPKSIEKSVIEYNEDCDICLINKAKMGVMACGVFILIGVLAICVTLSVKD